MCCLAADYVISGSLRHPLRAIHHIRLLLQTQMICLTSLSEVEAFHLVADILLRVLLLSERKDLIVFKWFSISQSILLLSIHNKRHYNSYLHPSNASCCLINNYSKKKFVLGDDDLSL